MILLGCHLTPSEYGVSVWHGVGLCCGLVCFAFDLAFVDVVWHGGLWLVFDEHRSWPMGDHLGLPAAVLGLNVDDVSESVVFVVGNDPTPFGFGSGGLHAGGSTSFPGSME